MNKSLITYLVIIVLGLVFMIKAYVESSGAADIATRDVLALKQGVEPAQVDMSKAKELSALDKQQIEAESGNATIEIFVSNSLVYMYFLLLAALIGSMIMPLVLALMHNPKSLVGTLISIAILLVVFFICYAISGNEVSLVAKKVGWEDNAYYHNLSQMVGGSLIMMYIMLVIVFVGTLAGEVYKMFK